MNDDKFLDIPDFLNRSIHPEYTITPQELAKIKKREEDNRRKQLRTESMEREFQRLRGKISKMRSNGEPDPESISGRIIESFRKRVTKIRETINDQ
jgi:hypothetical protein